MRHAVPASTKPGPKSRRAGPQSVGRIFGILDCIAAERSGATLSELARITGSPKTSLVGLLAGLTAEGCLVRDTSGRYALGPRVHSLATQAMAGREFVMLARPVLQSLVEATGETAVIGALAPDAELAVYLDKVESSNPIRYTVTVGERRELYCTAMGKALLAGFEPARLRRYLKATPRRRWTETTITSAADLLAEAARVRRDGIARTNGERVGGASGLGAPVFAGDGSVVAALLMAGPSERMRANQRRNEALLLQAAAECSRLAGGGHPARAAKAPAP
jgi:IclR family transcriptional regulator, acetate operon repressor